MLRVSPPEGGRNRRAHRVAAALAAGLALAMIGASAAFAATPTAPPPLTVVTGSGAVGHGDIFVSPFGDATTYANGAEILDRTGQELWFHPAPAGEEDADFRTQTLHGRPVLTFWEGTNLGGLSTGTDYIYNDHYQRIASVQAGGGLSADGHEFLVTNRGDAWILAYKATTADLTSIGGPADQTVIDGVVQEIDIRTGKVLFSWNSADHVPYGQSEQPLPTSASTAWDWFHINAVKLTSDGNLLIDARNTWTAYKVSSRTGQIIWQLGGKASSFKLQAAAGQRSTTPARSSPGSTTPSRSGHRLHGVRQRVGRRGQHRSGLDLGVRLRPSGHDPPQRSRADRDARRIGQPARGSGSDVTGQRPAPARWRRVRRLGHPALHLAVRRGWKARVQRRVPDRRQHLPGVFPSMAAGRQRSPGTA